MKRHSEQMLAVVKNPSAKSGLEPDSYTNRIDHTQPLYRLSQILIFMLLFNSKIAQYRICVHCSQINHAFVSKAAMSSNCTLRPCGLWQRLAKKENKHRRSPQHMQLLWRNWARRSSQVQHQLTCMVHIFAGGTNTRVRTPRKWAPWCSLSLMVHKKINHRLTSIEHRLALQFAVVVRRCVQKSAPLSLCTRLSFTTFSSNQGKRKYLFDHSVPPLGQACSHSQTEHHLFGTVCQQVLNRHRPWTFPNQSISSIEVGRVGLGTYLKYLSNSSNSLKQLKLTLGDPV